MHSCTRVYMPNMHIVTENPSKWTRGLEQMPTGPGHLTLYLRIAHPESRRRNTRQICIYAHKNYQRARRSTLPRPLFDHGPMGTSGSQMAHLWPPATYINEDAPPLTF